jgi:DNA-binding HxlR family transcriptional regulator
MTKKSSRGKSTKSSDHYQSNPELDKLVMELIGRVADKWTMAVIDVLYEQGEVRFTQLGKLVPGISQKMLTQTVRQMERDGLLTRKIYPVIPPKVEYQLTDLGRSLSYAFCTVWEWAMKNQKAVEKARHTFDSNKVSKEV